MKKFGFLIILIALAGLAVFGGHSNPLLSLGEKHGRVIEEDGLSMDPHKINVIDGDSFQYEGRVYDVAYIDAPEIGQACKQKEHMWQCGLEAAFSLRKIFELEQGGMTCVLSGADGDTAADCITGDLDLSEHLLREGLVVAQDDAPPAYRIAQEKAQEASLGIWRGKFIMPDDWREGERLPEEHKHDPNAPLLSDLPWHFSEGQLYYDPETYHLSCIVKGKVMSANEHVYFTPMDEAYPKVTIDQDKGDTVFCGDNDARAHGFTHTGERPEESAANEQP